MLLDYPELDHHSAVPMYEQVYSFFRQNLITGRIQSGERLPSIRRLADELQVSRTTVELAYQQLCAEGYVESRPQSGYYAHSLRNAGQLQSSSPLPSVPPVKAPALRFRFTTDSIDLTAFRVDLWQRYIREVLSRQDIIGAYGDPQGEWELRKELAEYCHMNRGVSTSPEQIVVGAGTQALLSMLSGILRRNDRMIGMESPYLPQAARTFSDCGLEICALPCDQSGIRADLLEHSDLRIIYVTPASRLSTGSPIPMPRRIELISWASRRGGWIIEDDYNGELRYSSRPFPALQSVGSGENVVYIGSFSKLLLPSVRISYMVLPRSLMATYRGRVSEYNQTASRIEQLALARMLRENEMDKQIRRLRKLYSNKSELLESCLRREFGEAITVAVQETTLRMVVCPGIRCTAQHLCNLAAKEEVQILPFDEESEFGKVILGFAGIAQEQIPEAVRRLRLAWQAEM